MIRPKLSPSDQTSLSRWSYYMLEEHNFMYLGFLPICRLWGTMTQAFSSEMFRFLKGFLKSTFFPWSFLIKDRETLVCGAVFSGTFSFLLPHMPFPNKELFLLLPPFLTDGIPVSNPPFSQNFWPAASDLYSAPSSKQPVLQVPSLKQRDRQERNHQLHPDDPDTQHQET